MRISLRRIRAKSWSPYAVGVGIGLLSWFAFATADQGLGITTAFEHTAAFADGAVSGKADNPYFVTHAPKIGWEWMLVLGVFLGSVLSSTLSDDRRHPVVPRLWRDRFGNSTWLRFAFAFAGGAVMMLGARLAVVFGALLFGLGLAVLGYCPGTTVAAVGEGRKDALAGLAGMFAGAFVFVHFFRVFGALQTSIADFGPITLPDLTNVLAALWVAALGMLAITVYVLTRHRGNGNELRLASHRR